MQQTWFAKFKKNKRGYYAFIAFAVIFLLTFFAEIIANDKPIMVRFGGHYYFPIISKISETKFGGVFETEADYRDVAVQKMILQNEDDSKNVQKNISKQGNAYSAANHSDSGNFIIWPLLHFSYDTINYNLQTPAPSKPTAENLLGTDDNGRDVLARIIYGVRISLIFGILLTIFSVIIAIFLGAVQGYFAGFVDIILQRFTEIWSAMPVLFLLIIMSSVLEPSFFTLIGLMLLFSWMSLVVYVRAEFLRLKNFEFVMAAKALGASNWRIIVKHILPNASSVIISNLPFLLSGSIITLTSLDFLGLGMPVGEPSLGELLAQGKNNITAWWLGLSGFVVISVILTLLIFIGEAVRDAFDARK